MHTHTTHTGIHTQREAEMKLGGEKKGSNGRWVRKKVEIFQKIYSTYNIHLYGNVSI